MFIDTNVLLYAVSTEPAEAAKTLTARRCLQQSDWAWSAQVAAEFIRASTSARQKKPLTRADAKRWVVTWMAFPMCQVDGALVLEAVDLSERFQISHFDAQVIAAAKRMGCAKVWSEDLNHDQDYAGVVVRNPFVSP